MANRVNNWKELLKLANKNLKNMGIEIILGKDDEESSDYFLNIAYSTHTDTFATCCYEDELGELINDAWAHALTLTHNVEKLVEAYFKLSDAEKDKFLRMTGNQ